MKSKQKTSKFIRLSFIISLLLTFHVLVDISSVLADYVGTDVNRIFIDPDSMSVVADGYQVGDEVSFIFETPPAYDGKRPGRYGCLVNRLYSGWCRSH